jgi:hypothetical protein
MKSSTAEVRRRVEEVFRLRLGGAEFADIVQFASAPEQNWQVGHRQLWNYIAAADKLIVERFDVKARYLLARHLLQRRQLYAHAVGAGDFSTALRVLDSEAKLEGLYPADLVEQRLAAVEKLLAALEARQQPAPPAGGAACSA